MAMSVPWKKEEEEEEEEVRRLVSSSRGHIRNDDTAITKHNQSPHKQSTSAAIPPRSETPRHTSSNGTGDEKKEPLEDRQVIHAFFSPHCFRIFSPFLIYFEKVGEKESAW